MYAMQETRYRDYDLLAAATRYSDGMIRVSATLVGGLRQTRSYFRFQSSESNVQAACARALRDLSRLIDELR